MQSGSKISSTFIWRRVHSFMGLWLVMFLIFHLLVNSQAALWLGDKGANFIRMANSLESMPFVDAIEIIFLAAPFFIHMVWGVQRALQAKTNASQLKYERNRAFTWQRLTSWILLFGLIAHVIQMRFLNEPEKITVNGKKQYAAVIQADENLIQLASQIGAGIRDAPQNQVEIYAPAPGVAMLFMVRDTFKNPWMVFVYLIFVIAASFHAFNGIWTGMISWGVLLSNRSQKVFISLIYIGMALLVFLGAAAIFGSS